MLILNEDTNLYETSGISESELLNFAKSLIAKKFIRGDILSNSETTKAFLSHELALETSEHFCVIWLDNRHRVLCFDRMFNGTINQCSVYPRELVKRGLELNAGAAILAHNHPSGDCEPSFADRQITSQIQKAFELIDIRVIDHIIVAGINSVSMASRGLI